MDNEVLIIWAPVAEINYNKILRYIIKNWSVNAAIEFDKKTNVLLSHIVNNNKICPKSNITNFRKCVITSQSSLIYRINKSSIEIIDVISNYSQHKY